MPTSGPRSAPRKKAADAYRLRCTGRTFDEIATALGYGSPASAHKAVIGHIKRMPAEDQDMARAFSAGNYQQIIAELYSVAARAKTAGKLTTAVQALEAAANTQAKKDQLEGLHIAVPTKVDVNVQHSAVAVIDQAKEQLLALVAKQPQPAALPVIDAEVVP